MIVSKDIPEMALRNTFVDPIVFCIWEGDMTYSVCYRKPTTVSPFLLLKWTDQLMTGNGTYLVILDSKRDRDCTLHPAGEFINR